MFRLLRNVELGFKTLWLHKMRSLLTMLGVIIGVSSVIAMLAFGEGNAQQALNEIRKMGTNNIIIHSVQAKESSQEQGSGRGNRVNSYGLKYDDEIRIRKNIPTVKNTVPVRRLDQKEAHLGGRVIDVNLVGTTPEWFKVIDSPVIAGRVITIEDLEKSANIAVLTDSGARKMLATQNSLGQTIIFNDRVFTVVGIVKNPASLQTPGAQSDQEIDVYLPLSTCRERFGELISKRGAGSETREYVDLHQIVVQVQNMDDVLSTAQTIDRTLSKKTLKRLKPEDFQNQKMKEYKIVVPYSILQQAKATQARNTRMLAAIAAISLLVGGIGIMNIMLASVTERTREIGIRRAIGARKSQIILQFLIETVVLSSFGGLIGVKVGVLIPKITAKIYAGEVFAVIQPWAIVIAFGSSIFVGIVFGLYPAIRAANLDPIEALRHE